MRSALGRRGIVEGASPCQRQTSEIRVGIQFGIAYAPAILVQELGLLQARLPGVRLSWRQFRSGAMVSNALEQGEIDVGMMGVAPFLGQWPGLADRLCVG